MPCTSPIKSQSQGREVKEPFTERLSQTEITWGVLIGLTCKAEAAINIPNNLGLRSSLGTICFIVIGNTLFIRQLHWSKPLEELKRKTSDWPQSQHTNTCTDLSFLGQPCKINGAGETFFMHLREAVELPWVHIINSRLSTDPMSSDRSPLRDSLILRFSKK